MRMRTMLCNHVANNGLPDRVSDEAGLLRLFLQSSPAAVDCPLNIDGYPFEQLMQMAALEGMAVSVTELGDDGTLKLQTNVARLPANVLRRHLEQRLTLDA